MQSKKKKVLHLIYQRLLLIDLRSKIIHMILKFSIRRRFVNFHTLTLHHHIKKKKEKNTTELRKIRRKNTARHFNRFLKMLRT